MIPIDLGKFDLPYDVVKKRCSDGSVRFIRYTQPEPPKQYATMEPRSSYYGVSTQYTVSVHLPPLRDLSELVTVAHTSSNCWKVTVSTPERSDIITCKTLNEVISECKNVFK